MTTAKKGDIVAIDYVVRTGDGRVVGGTEKEGPQTLTLGQAEIFPEIEAALDGMEVGEEKAVTVPSDNAFGPRREVTHGRSKPDVDAQLLGFAGEAVDDGLGIVGGGEHASVFLRLEFDAA